MFGPGPDRDPKAAERRLEHLLRTADPSSRVAVDADGTVVGAALTVRRGHLTILALAIVDEPWQGKGLGRGLLAEFPEREAGRNRVIMSSTDPKAMRRYAALGLRLRPTVSACGILRPGAARAPSGTETVDLLEGAAILDAIAAGDDARREPYGDDAQMWHREGDALHLAGEDAAVVRGGGVLRIAVARTPQAGALALRAALAAVPPGQTVHLHHLREGQDWAIREMLGAGLALSPEGPIFSDRALGALHLPTGTVF